MSTSENRQTFMIFASFCFRFIHAMRQTCVRFMIFFSHYFHFILYQSFAIKVVGIDHLQFRLNLYLKSKKKLFCLQRLWRMVLSHRNIRLSNVKLVLILLCIARTPYTCKVYRHCKHNNEMKKKLSYHSQWKENKLTTTKQKKNNKTKPDVATKKRWYACAKSALHSQNTYKRKRRNETKRSKNYFGMFHSIVCGGGSQPHIHILRRWIELANMMASECVCYVYVRFVHYSHKQRERNTELTTRSTASMASSSFSFLLLHRRLRNVRQHAHTNENTHANNE